jgi:hypothetical protein
LLRENSCSGTFLGTSSRKSRRRRDPCAETGHFRYKKEIDPDRTPEFGLVAEDVEKVNPDLVARDAGGKVYTVRYDAVNAMLLNEFLKEHRTVQEQQNEIEALRAELKEQRELIQKVNDKVELNRPAPQTLANGQ